MHWLADLFARARWTFALFLVVMTGLAIWGYRPRAAERPSVRSFDKLAQTEAAEADEDTDPLDTREVTNAFNLRRSDAFLVVECDDLFRPESARAVRAMVRAVEDLPVVDTVFWVDDVPMLNVFGFAEPLMPESDASPKSFRQARHRLLNHPLASGQLISPDGTTLMMPLVYDWLHLETNEDLTDGVLRAARGAIDKELARLSESAEKPKFRIRITGTIPLFIAQESAFQRNEKIFRIVGYGLAFVLSVVLFRGVSAVLILSAAPMLSIFWCFGIMKLFDVYINELANVVMPVLVSMIALTDGVHLMVNIRRRRALGDTPREASRWAIAHVGVACFLTSLTTAIGFGSLMLAKSNYVGEFGKVCMYGVMIAFLAVISFLPFVASTRLGRNIHQGEQRDLVGPWIVRMTPMLDWILEHRGRVSLLSVLVTLAMLTVALGLRPDSRIANQLPSGTDAYRALRHCDEHFGGIQFLQLWVEWPKDTPDDAPEILASIHDLEDLVSQETLVSHPLSIRSMLASFPGDANDLRTQMTFLSLLPDELRGFFFRPKARQAQVVTRVQDQGIAAYVPVFDRLEDELRELVDKYPGFRFWLDGGPVFRARNLYQIVVDLATSLGAASIIILVVLAVVYQSIRIGLISVIPNMFPLAATAAMLVVIGEPLYMASVCAFTVCLGIAVDDTIHFLSRFRQELAVDGNRDNAIRRTFQHVGAAMVITTIILISGFAAMTVSDLPAHRIFAAMACATIGTAILGDLIALPALLAQFTKDAPKTT
jgi:predicted RND superfamily exporter protein